MPWHQRAPVRWFKHPVRAAVLSATLVAAGFAVWWAGRQLWANHLWNQAEKAIADYDFRVARKHLESYLRIRPADGAGHFLMARTCRRMQDYVTWDDHLQKCQKLRYDPAGVDLEQLLTQVQSGDMRGGEARVLALLEEIHPQEVLILEALVKGYLQAHRLREAFRWAGIWFQRHPGDQQPLLWRALSSEMAHYYASAIQDYRQALEIKPDNADVHFRLGNVLFIEGQYQEAVAHYLEFERLDPDSTDALVKQAQSYRSLGDADSARAALERLFAKTENSPGGFLVRAQLEMDAEKPEAGLAWLRRAEKLAPNEADILHSIALVLRRLEKDEEAAKYETRLRDVRDKFDRLERVQNEILSKPGDPALRVEAARLLMDLGREGEAARWLLSVQHMNPNYRPMHAAFADFYERAGKTNRAVMHRRLAGGSDGKLEKPTGP